MSKNGRPTKLSINRQTVRRLSDFAMESAAGGYNSVVSFTTYYGCPTGSGGTWQTYCNQHSCVHTTCCPIA